MMPFLFFLVLVYVLVNLYVTKKINKALYLKEERREYHKKFIWYVPFLGPLIIRGFWKTQKETEMEIMTKNKRKKAKGSFHESEKGFEGGY